VNGPLPPAVAGEADTRRAMLHLLEDLQRERDAIRDAHQQWLNTVDAVRDPLMVHDAAGRLVRANRAYAERAGQDFKGLIGRPYWECFPKGDGPLPGCGPDELFAQQDRAHEQEFVLASGEVFVSRVFIVAASGQQLLALHLLEDVTEKRRTEKALRESEQRLAGILNSQETFICRVDLQDRFTYLNDVCARVFAARIGDRTWPMIHPDDVVEARANFATIHQPPYRCTIEVRNRIQGEWRWVRWQNSVIRDAGGQIVEIQGVGFDITEQRAAEHRLRMLNTLYATLSAVNHAIVQSKSRREICERIVRIGTEIGLWQGAWVGFVEPQTRRIVPEAWSKGMAPYMDKLAVSIDPEVPEGQGPTGVAVRSGVPYFCNDTLADPRTAPWRAFAESSGTNSVATIPLLVAGSPPGVVNLYSREKEMFTPEVRELVIEMGDDINYALEAFEREHRRHAAEEALLMNQGKLRRSLEATVEAIAATVETRDPYTAGHQRRVADLARAIGREMGLSEDMQEGLHFGALIHDLGKVQIPAEILSKPTRLTKLEFELIKTHPQAGYDIVKGIEFPWRVADMVHQHHERFDGSGYPQGLKGDAIALEARILAVADVVEAMASHRPYRAGLGIEAALKEIETKRGIWFDPAPVDACLRLFREKRFTL
jgi:PAS domain S-box-containing protein